MTSAAAAVLAVTVAGVLVVAAAVGWALPRGGRGAVAVATVLAGGLATLGLLGVLGGPLAGAGDLVASALLVDLFLVAAFGGGPLTATVLWLADRGTAGGAIRGSHAEEVLRGGAWIGVFERVAVFATLTAGWPEGLAVVLALKGLGRYSELRADAREPAPGGGAATGGVAERFIIGTFASVLWAVGCAGALAALTR